MAIITPDKFRILDPVLTQMAQGYQNATMVANHIFPTVAVQTAKGKIPKFNKTAFITRNTNRATGANSNRINDLEYSLIDIETIENDVEIALDYLEEDNGENFLKLEQKIMKDLADILALGKEKAAADLVQSISNYLPGATTNCTNDP